ncbi:hypothetical protein [Endozoicomonas sp. GU-1]|uniref:hypothetical protein n=1 Tax=Endozoicomonas sp. GU-1 TaxID=3009078 RepID=UPI0022B3D64F|nr:hypothetical protein [Endozoicomonas sp. GU-1]WBA80278.1 hypothetical protein O2T12_18325 [Endozoicomonas sp. GU-1]WBA87848.1 hypothetical protein O3276_07535 [Endozoicomonas sp. GU-1]
MHVESAKVPLPLSTQLSTEQPASAAQSVPQFTADSFDNQPGAEILATRLNTFNENISAILNAKKSETEKTGTEKPNTEGLDASDIALMCKNFTSAFNLDDILVEESSQLKAIQILLTLTNCHDINSLKAFANSKLDENPDNQDDCQKLKDSADKDNNNPITLPPGYGMTSQNFSFFRDKLMNSFIDSQFSEANFETKEMDQLKDALRMAKMQIAGNTGIGNFKESITFDQFDREQVSKLTGSLIYPRQKLCADNLAKEILALQQQLFDSDSGLIGMLGNNEDITNLLQGNQPYHLKQLLARQGADNRATLTNDAALLVSFVARNSKFADEFAKLDINPENLTHLAKAHSILNHGQADEHKELSNEIAAKGLKGSDDFTRTFFKSETANKYKAEPPFARIALWLAESNQSG